MKFFALLLTIVASSSLVLAQTPPLPPVQRHVQNQTLVSAELPAADFTFAKELRYVGAQVVQLYAGPTEVSAIAEQHLFVESGPDEQVKRFYWVQFEHRTPDTKYTYDYKLPGATDLGGLSFVYDTKSFLDYDSDFQNDPRSDRAAIARLLAQHHLAFPKNAARVRMFHLPTPDHRTELMIIYGEALSADSKILASKDSTLLSDASPEFAKLLLDHAKQSLTIHKN